MTDLHSRRPRHRVHIGYTIAEGKGVDVDSTWPVSPTGTMGRLHNTHRSLLCVAMYSFRGSHATPWTLCKCSRRAKMHSPVMISAQLAKSSHPPLDAFQMVAVLSVDPAMKNSLSGDHARS